MTTSLDHLVSESIKRATLNGYGPELAAMSNDALVDDLMDCDVSFEGVDREWLLKAVVAVRRKVEVAA
jgi:hypothetical protein